MRAVEIARKLASLGQNTDARQAYALALQTDTEPAEALEAAAFILQTGGDYKISYTAFLDLYRRGFFREEIMQLVSKVFYEPNIKLLKSRYERNCKRLSKYPYLFRKDFPPFEELPIRFFPYDDHNGYIPFYVDREEFGDFVNIQETVISRNFFKDLEKPVFASDVYSQYELEYLNDNVRRSEWVARENHIYLHYSDWAVFCSWLQVLNVRPLTEAEKVVFLIEDEKAQYPIDFKERFGIDYSQYSVKPLGIREVTRMIWHTQLSTHNGGDFFNEVFDNHPNLIVLPSLMMSDVLETAGKVRKVLEGSVSLRDAQKNTGWSSSLVEELYHMRDRTDKDLVVALYLRSEMAMSGTDPNARIVPALFFQPHFHNIVYTLRADEKNRTVLEAANYDEIHQSALFRNFKYIKTFTPMRRFTTSHAASVRFMYNMAQAADDKGKGKQKTVVSDAVTERILNRSFMIDPEDRLYKDGILVRFEDGKLNPKATLTALAAFLDVPYHEETMSYCSEGGKPVRVTDDGYAPGFSPMQVYKTYDEFANDSERYFIEYFLRDAYAYYGYDFHYYDGKPMDESKAEELIQNFSTINHYMKDTWIKVFREAEVSRDGERVEAEVEERVQKEFLDKYIRQYDQNRLKNVKILLEGLRFINKKGQPLHMMPKLELDPALLENPIYH